MSITMTHGPPKGLKCINSHKVWLIKMYRDYWKNYTKGFSARSDDENRC